MTINNDSLSKMNHENATRKFMDSVNILFQQVNELYQELELEGLVYKQQKPLLPRETCPIQLKVLSPDGNGTSAQVKFYPMIETIAKEAFSKANHRIDTILKYADNQGNLFLELPKYTYEGFEKGQINICPVRGYYLEVSKGSEYEIISDVISISDFVSTSDVVSTEDEEKMQLQYTLNSIINLKQAGWFAGDLHHHSIYSSPVFGGTDDVSESAQEVMVAMTAMGLSFGALSDHHNILNHQDWKNTQTSYFLPIVSKEISTSNGHVMSLNVPRDVIYDIPKPEQRTKEFLLGEYFRITKQIKEQGGLAQINHPRDMNPAISLSSELTAYIEIFDTMEIWNGSIPMLLGTTNDQAFNLWLDLLKDDRFIPATTGSDTHNTRANDYHEMLDELMWLVYHLKNWVNQKGAESVGNQWNELLKAAAEFIQLFEVSVDTLEKWAKENLGTGGVRTYVHSPDSAVLEAGMVLEGLRKGRSFLTNGPILIATLMGHRMGEIVQLKGEEEKITLTCQVISNRKLEQLQIINKNGILITQELQSLKPNIESSFEIEIKVKELNNQDFVICRASSDHTNQVITNPIFINKIIIE